ncbi:MAG: DNA mismatch repair protein MutS [Pseudomonadota bacterium]
MMAQYLDIKAANADALLFYRMGDFYEMFFDDAVAAAEALDIALTKRGKHNGDDIPMCGVPVHAAEGYLLTLIRKGFRVAVCEQMESPAEAKKRGSKSVVKRDVVRLVTPGTLTEDSLLEARRHNYLAAFTDVRGDAALSWVDISTGAFHVMPVSLARLSAELARLAPSEVLVPDNNSGDLRDIVEDFGIALTELSKSTFDSTNCDIRLRDLFGINSLDAYGGFSRAEVSAMGALVQYLEITQRGKLPLLRAPRKESATRTVQIDASTRRNLELSQSLNGGRTGTLLAAIDRTVTSGGARLLERRIASPSRVLDVVLERHDAVAFFVDDGQTRERLRDRLRQVPDIDRALSRLSLDRGGPRDLAAIRTALTEALAIQHALQGASLPSLLREASADLEGHDILLDLLDRALVAEPPLLTRDGDYIAPDFDEDLDTVRKLRDEGRGVIAQMQQEYTLNTGIASLKIKHNNVLGYFVEVTATHAEKMLSPPMSETFIHRQTTANQVRFTTTDLAEMETRILNAGSRALDIENGHFDVLRSALLAQATEIAQTAAALATFDVTAALARLAYNDHWIRPKLDESRSFEIKAGRHPVVEAALQQQGAPYVSNDCSLSAADKAARIWLLTGPNMAGKSTFLRQNALMAILAQAGSFIPADEAHIGLVSQVFSRVGASDDLAKGRSTFMVEMVETAAILNQADDRALIILDEIGRGTATYDGLSIAWATLEHLHDVNRSRALFATHYHEMTALAGKLAGVENATVAVREWEGEVIFLHEVRQGAADRSYGVQVAQLAGLPASVVSRARVILEALEKGERESGSTQKALIDDLPLFSAVAAAPLPARSETSVVEAQLADIHPDEITPKEALELLYRLKAAVKS